jgi:tetratricopeptide (TPR) repeat protein
MRLFGLFLALALCAPVARADSIADEADFRFHRAANLYRQGKVEEALSEFLASNRLVRNRNVIFNIARSFEQLGRFNEAYRWYTEILADEMPEGDRKDLMDGLKRLRPALALLQVQSTPAGATVYVDRRDLGARGLTPVTLALPAADGGGAARARADLRRGRRRGRARRLRNPRRGRAAFALGGPGEDRPGPAHPDDFGAGARVGPDRHRGPG